MNEEELDNLNLDNTYRFDNNHIIKPKISKREYQEIDEEVENLPFGMSIIQPYSTLTP